MSEHPFRPLLSTQSDLEQMWRRLMSPLGFGARALWMVVVEDDRPVPQVTEFSQLPSTPDEEFGEGLVNILGGLAPSLADDASFAFLLTRPGGGRPDAHDIAWARTLYEVGRRVRMPLTVIHLAHDHDVLPMSMDDLLAEPA
jgi:hypothetical protein